MFHSQRTQKRKKQTRIKSQSLLDDIVYLISLGGPIMTIPQIYDVWVKKNAGVNILSWSSYVVFAAIWTYYGIVRRDKPIIINNLLWVIAEGLVVIGAILYK